MTGSITLLTLFASDTSEISVTGSPVDVSGGDEVEQTTPLVGLDEASVENGAI